MPRGTDPVDQSRLEGRLWTPQIIRSSVALWLDAADLATLSTGALGITQWADKGPYQWHAIPTEAGRNPHLQLEAQNGLTALKFDNDNDGVSGSFNITLTEESVFLAFNYFGVTSTYPRYFTQADDASKDYQASDGLIPAYRPNTNTIACLQSAKLGEFAFSSGPIIYGLVVGSNGKMYKNGALQTTFALSLNKTFTRYAIGTSPLADNTPPFENINSNYFEVLVLSTAASDDRRQKVEGYLAWKWGLRSLLPGNHPYLNQPPLR